MGLILFLLYTSEVSHKPDITVATFADDTTLLVTNGNMLNPQTKYN